MAANGLTELPTEVGRLTTLEILDLTSNHLTALPEELGCCVRLTELEASHNRLASVPASLGNLVSLVEIDLSANELTTLPPELARLTALRHLKLCHCRLQRLPRELAALVPPPDLRFTTNSNDAYACTNGDRTAYPGRLSWLSTEGNPELADLPEALASITEREFRGGRPLVSPFSSPSSPPTARDRGKERGAAAAAAEPVEAGMCARYVCWAEMRGLRPTMEDTVYVNHALRPDTQLYAIFDGHRGSDAAEIAAAYVGKAFDQALRQHGDDVGQAIFTAFRRLEDIVLDSKTEAGCTAVVALVHAGKTPRPPARLVHSVRLGGG